MRANDGVMPSVQEALATHIANRAHSGSAVPFLVGICGAQGSGKTTLSEQIRVLLQDDGLTVVVLSIDDLYFSREVRRELGESVHPLLRTRGVPGTHDVELGLAVVDALGVAGSVSIPAFDKACDDRVPSTQWRQVDAPVDVLILEGWCVGAMPECESALLTPLNQWEREFDPHGIWRRFVNASLAGRYQSLYSRIDLLILLKAPAFDVVFGWRLEQEKKLRETLAQQGRDADHVMSDTEILQFISHYERLTRHILEEMPSRADVLVTLDRERRATIVRP
jgi:D-glycerate 3-kinase